MDYTQAKAGRALDEQFKKELQLQLQLSNLFMGSTSSNSSISLPYLGNANKPQAMSGDANQSRKRKSKKRTNMQRTSEAEHSMSLPSIPPTHEKSSPTHNITKDTKPGKSECTVKNKLNSRKHGGIKKDVARKGRVIARPGQLMPKSGSSLYMSGRVPKLEYKPGKTKTVLKSLPTPWDMCDKESVGVSGLFEVTLS
jgi:hypothetical protein